MTRIFLSAVGSFLLASLLNKLMIPVLRALKAGQSIREVGPTWHNNKSGTPIMGGLMFIAAALLCLLVPQRAQAAEAAQEAGHCQG